MNPQILPSGGWGPEEGELDVRNLLNSLYSWAFDMVHRILDSSIKGSQKAEY